MEQIIFKDCSKGTVEQIRKYLSFTFPDVVTTVEGKSGGLLQPLTEEEEYQQQMAMTAAVPPPNIPARVSIPHVFFPLASYVTWQHSSDFVYEVVGDDGSGYVRISARARLAKGAWSRFAGSPFNVPHSELTATTQPACLQSKQTGPHVFDPTAPKATP